jgi:hypothetical protein
LKILNGTSILSLLPLLTCGPLTGEENNTATLQDILFVTVPIFGTNNALENLPRAGNMTKLPYTDAMVGFDNIEKYGFAKIFDNHMAYITSTNNLAFREYFSQAPYHFGPDRFVRYCVKSVESRVENVNDLTASLRDLLARQSVDFDLMVQFQENPATEQIDELNTEWKTQFQKIARIHVPQQTVKSQVVSVK